METLTYNQRKADEQFWFVIGSMNRMKELQIRDEARQMGLEAFVPVEYAFKTVRGEKQRSMVPAFPGLIFVKATTTELQDFFEKSIYTLFPRKSTFTNKEEFLTVPNRDMENFIAVTEKAEAHITYFKPDEISLQEGDKIRIKGGLYDGREGIIMRIKGKRNKHLVVQIPGVLVAAVELQPEMVELTKSQGKDPHDESRERKSKNIDKDKKLVFQTAHRLLFEIPDKYKEEAEYYLLLSELRRGVARIHTFKGYTPATEAELALALFLASVALQGESLIDPSMARERLEKAVLRLKDSSKLKAECLSYLERLKG